jgi:predicted glycoside hydrolase/deacetylase ChbG (UPF0249 family)
MLIINADDWGYDTATTDAIVAVHREARVTSATAMVYMQDSVRAASIASKSSIPIGLHLNLMEQYSDVNTPADVRSRQKWVVSQYRTGYRRRWIPGRRLFSTARVCIEDQLEAFAELYGDLTHVDGHQHGHLSSAALWTLASRDNLVIRRGFTFRRSDKRLHNRMLRLALNRSLDLRFRTTDGFHSIRTLHPRLGGHGLEEIFREAQDRDIEIMVHPALPDEFEILMSAEWASLLSDVPLGSYRDLIDDPGR